MSRAAAWRWCLAAGVVAFGFTFWFGAIPGLVACGAVGMEPILAFEFVASPADVARLFGVEPCRSTLVAAQRTGLLVDGLGFIPAYTAFLILAAAAVRPARRGAFAAIAAALIVAAIADEIEGLHLWAILGDLPGDQPTIDRLAFFVHLKFALLSLATAAIGASLIAARRPLGIAAGALTAGGALWSLATLATGAIERMMLGYTIAWVTLLVTAAFGVVRPSSFLPGTGRGTAAR